LINLGQRDEPPRLQRLQRLDLSENYLSTLPPELGELRELRVLDLFANRLASIPESSLTAPGLTRLDLARNRLSSLPDSVGKLNELRELDVAANRLSLLREAAVPNGLTKLDLTANEIVSLPDVFGSMAHLRELIADDNRITYLPADVSSSQSLRLLSLRDNPIAELPAIPHCVIVNSAGPTLELLLKHISGGPQPHTLYFESPSFFFDILIAVSGIATLISALRLYFKNATSIGPVDLTFTDGSRVRINGITRQKAIALVCEHEDTLRKGFATIDMEGARGKRAIDLKRKFVEDTLLRVPGTELIERKSGNPVAIASIVVAPDYKPPGGP
jgi:hypothetical protein